MPCSNLIGPGAVTSIFEPLEARQMLSGEYRTMDGTGNNLDNWYWGSGNTQLMRMISSAYANGTSAPAGSSRPSARVISNAVAAHSEDEILNARTLSAFGYLWGQFIDHDLDLTGAASPAEPFNVVVPTGDPYFDPNGTGNQLIFLNRSQYAAGTGITTPRQQMNAITAYIDGSMVYGSDDGRSMALRTGIGGLLKTSTGNLLPFNTMGLPNDSIGGPASALFVAGDVRANENIELTALHTLFMREHNRLATMIGQANPLLTDDEIFNQARKLVGAEIQHITYDQYLPALLGAGAMAPYAGYNPSVNPSIATEFSTAAFRLGHSMLADDVEFFADDGEEVREEIPLAQAFFNPAMVQQTGIDPILKYLASSNSEEIDNQVVNGVRNFLFGQPGAGGFDLASLNIQRGRDHGLADYNSTRVALGLPKIKNFNQISSNNSLRQTLKSLYGSVDNVDLWVGALAEDHLAGSSLGPTLQRIVSDQFTRVRDGDRFWYEYDLTASELQMVQVTLADVMRNNTTLANLQDDVFFFNVEITGRVWNDTNNNGLFDGNERGISNRQVNLFDEDGALVESVRTDHDGIYLFSNVQIGEFTVQPGIPNGWHTTTTGSREIQVTRGQRFEQVNFGQNPGRAPVVNFAWHDAMNHIRSAHDAGPDVDANDDCLNL